MKRIDWSQWRILLCDIIGHAVLQAATCTIFVLQDFSVIDSLDTAENNQESEEGTDVYFEILTNWGNPKYLGLTEVCVKICNSCNHKQSPACIMCLKGLCSFILIYMYYIPVIFLWLMTHSILILPTFQTCFYNFIAMRKIFPSTRSTTKFAWQQEKESVDQCYSWF